MAFATDDEVIAVVVKEAGTWPGPLPTVTMRKKDMLLATFRGVKSLVDRDLATMIGIDYQPDAELQDLIRRVMSSTETRSIYIADASRPGEMLGSSAHLYASHGGAVLDLLTLDGLHSLIAVASTDGLALLESMASHIYRLGIEAAADTEPVAFLRSTARPDLAWRIGHASVSRGSVAGLGLEASFSVEKSGTWDALEVVTFFSQDG